MEIKGLKGTKVNIFQTTKTEDMADKGFLDIREGSVRISLPERSVVILIAK